MTYGAYLIFTNASVTSVFLNMGATRAGPLAKALGPLADTLASMGEIEAAEGLLSQRARIGVMPPMEMPPAEVVAALKRIVDGLSARSLWPSVSDRVEKYWNSDPFLFQESDPFSVGNQREQREGIEGAITRFFTLLERGGETIAGKDPRESWRILVIPHKDYDQKTEREEFLPDMASLLEKFLSGTLPNYSEDRQWEFVMLFLYGLLELLENHEGRFDGGWGEASKIFKRIFSPMASIGLLSPEVAFKTILKERKKNLRISPVWIRHKLSNETKKLLLPMLSDEGHLGEDGEWVKALSRLIFKGMTCLHHDINILFGEGDLTSNETLQEETKEILDLMDGIPFSRPLQRVFEEIFLNGEISTGPLLPKITDESFQTRLRQTWYLFFRLSQVLEKSDLLREWMDSSGFMLEKKKLFALNRFVEYWGSRLWDIQHSTKTIASSATAARPLLEKSLEAARAIDSLMVNLDRDIGLPIMSLDKFFLDYGWENRKKFLEMIRQREDLLRIFP